MTHNRSSELYVPDSIHPVFHEGGAIIMDTLAGDYKMLSTTSAVFLQLANLCGTIEAIDAYHSEILTRSSSDVIHKTTDSGLQLLTNAGVIAHGRRREPRNFIAAVPENAALVTDSFNVYQPPEITLSTGDKLRAGRDIARALHLIYRSFPYMEKGLRKAQERTERAATHEEASKIGAAVMQVGRYHPGRFACLEASVATVLHGSSQGLRIDMQFGFALHPAIYHVWPEAEGRPVQLKTDLTSQRFYPLYRIGEDKPTSFREMPPQN